MYDRTMKETITTLDMMIDTAMLMLIWLVQCIIYPAFRDIDPQQFDTWHRKYLRTISLFVIPLMLAQMVLTILGTRAAPGLGNIISILGISVAWLVTFCISAPCHQQLQRTGKDRDTIERVNRTNWLRTLAWTVVWLANLAA